MRAPAHRYPLACRVEDALDSYLAGGGGFVSLQAANNAFLKWENYGEMIGPASRNASFGPGLIIDDREQLVAVQAGEGLSRGHARGTTSSSPCWNGGTQLPRECRSGGCIRLSNLPTVSTPRPIRNTGKSTGKCMYSPMPGPKILCSGNHSTGVRQWGRGRIYVTTLGQTWRNEDNPKLRCAGFQTLFPRGVEWAASGK